MNTESDISFSSGEKVSSGFFMYSGYRYGFQGQEKDDEVKGEGNSVNYKYRMHDPRVGRFFAVDPLAPKYPHYTPYQFSGNKLIHAIELEGLEEMELNSGRTVETGPASVSSQISLAEITLADDEYVTKWPGDVQGFETVEIVASKKTTNIEDFEIMPLPGVIDIDLSINTENINVNNTFRGTTRSSSNNGFSGKDVVGGLLTVEGAYSNLLHDHTTYTTTKGKTKNIYKANGQVRSARAQGFANTSKTLRYIGEGGNVLTTGIAYYDIATGNDEPITYVDAGVGTMGIIASGASYFYGVRIPVVGEFVAVYGVVRVTWDVFYNFGRNYGPSKWYGTNDSKWFY